jgi:hypothetical protein
LPIQLCADAAPFVQCAVANPGHQVLGFLSLYAKFQQSQKYTLPSVVVALFFSIACGVFCFVTFAICFLGGKYKPNICNVEYKQALLRSQ